jgi:leucyl/phenylalanyl-tRNA--protein transferase
VPVYQLNLNLSFPPPELAEPSGLLAVGGDLSPERLLLAYSRGIFPWYSPGDPLLWWSPDPRTVIFPEEFHCPRRLQRTVRRQRFTVRADTCFSRVIEACATIPRQHEKGTWITREMQEAYIRLHEEGFAHSIETWQDGELAGGLYGVSLGRCFFGESMFSRVSDASKTALAVMVRKLIDWNFHFIDCQFQTDHLTRFGAREIPRHTYLRLLERALERPTRRGPWDFSPTT